MLQESVQFANISATTAPFALIGGMYGVAAVATWGGGSATFEQLGPDGTTWLTVFSFTANDGETYYLTPGSYRFEVATATAVYLSVTRVPIC